MLLGYRSNRGNAVTGMADNIVCQQGLILVRWAETIDRNFLANQRRHDTRHFLSLTYINFLDPGMRNTRPLDLGVEYARKKHVIDILSLAQPMHAAIRSRCPLTNRRGLLPCFGDTDFFRK